MNTSNILGILGIVATIVFGVWGIIIVVRRKYPGQLTYIKESNIGLFDSIVKNLPGLSVLYNNAPVGQGLVLIKGAILNTGSKDITNEMVEQKLTFALPEGFRWLTAKIVGNSGNAVGAIDIQDRSLVFTTGLFRCNESIRFQAIAEVPVQNAKEGQQKQGIEERLDEALSISHRIADTQKVSSFELPNNDFSKRRRRRWLIMSIATLVLAAFTIGLSYFRGVPVEARFMVNDTNAIPHEVQIRKDINGIMTLKGVSDGFRKQITPDEFSKLQPLNAKIVSSSKDKFMNILLGVYFVMPLALYLSACREHRKANKIRSLLGITEQG